MPTAVKAGLLIVASIIGTLIAADLILRAIGYLPRVDHEWLIGPKVDTRIPDDRLILIHPRFLEERHYAVDPTLETVVILGDSFVEGYPVEEADNFPSVLGRMLSERGRPVNIVNMGLGDSGPDQQLRLIKEYLLPRLTPDIVVWTFYANDISDNLRQAVYEIENDALVPLDAATHWLHIRQKYYRSIPLPGSVKESSPVLRLLLRALEVSGRSDIRLGDPTEQARSGEKIRLAIEEMDGLAHTYGFRAAYVLIAPQALYLREADPVRWDRDLHIAEHERLRPLVARQPEFIDAWFGDSIREFCGSKLDAPAGSALFADDGRDANRFGRRHFNEAGYALLAAVVAACLSSDAG